MQSNGWSLRSILCNLQDFSELFISNGLLVTFHCEFSALGGKSGSVQMQRLLRAVPLSMLAYLFSVSDRDLDANATGCPCCRSADPSPCLLASACYSQGKVSVVELE